MKSVYLSLYGTPVKIRGLLGFLASLFFFYQSTFPSSFFKADDQKLSSRELTFSKVGFAAWRKEEIPAAKVKKKKTAPFFTSVPWKNSETEKSFIFRNVHGRKKEKPGQQKVVLKDTRGLDARAL